MDLSQMPKEDKKILAETILELVLKSLEKKEKPPEGD